MIHFLVGRPRNGKSLRAMMHVIEQLTTTQRFIVTNMVIFLDELQEYMIAHGHDVNVHKRILMLTDKAQMREFFLYREFGFVIPKPSAYDDKKSDADVDYNALCADERFWMPEEAGKPRSMRGTCYLIDEVHTLWPARGWQGTSRHVDFYTTQHGKLNDEVWFITQNTKLVDPNFYRVAQDFTYCRNHRLLKHGRFKGANKFTGHTFDGPASTGREPTLNVETFHLDLEIARCYDTSAGVGMPGGGAADAGARTKGIPLWSIWVAIAACIVGVYWLFNYFLPDKMNGVVHNMVAKGSFTPQAGKPSPAPSSTPVRVSAPASAAPAFTPAEPERLWLRGYVVRGKRVNLYLSDGRTLTESDAEFDALTRNSALVDGKKIFLITPPQRPALAPADGQPSKAQPVASSAVPSSDDSSRFWDAKTGSWRLTPEAVAEVRSPKLSKS